jgi:guanylate kinase
MKTTKPGSIFIISAASGTGKTTLVSRVIANHPEIRVSVSHTTRAPRGGEIPGQHYHFIDPTSIEGVKMLQDSGFDVILEIDVQGAQQVRRNLPEAVGIFILPPSFQVLAERLHGRGTDEPEVIEKRLNKARSEIEQSLLFDYVVVNDDLVQAEMDLVHIIKSHRLTQPQQQRFIENLLENS